MEVVVLNLAATLGEVRPPIMAATMRHLGLLHREAVVDLVIFGVADGRTQVHPTMLITATVIRQVGILVIIATARRSALPLPPAPRQFQHASPTGDLSQQKSLSRRVKS